MFFKPSHTLQDIQYDAIGIKGSYYSRSTSAFSEDLATTENKGKTPNSIDSIFMMNNELIDELHKSSLGIHQQLFIYSFPVLYSYLVYEFFNFILDYTTNENLPLITTIFFIVVFGICYFHSFNFLCFFSCLCNF